MALMLNLSRYDVRGLRRARLGLALAAWGLGALLVSQVAATMLLVRRDARADAPLEALGREIAVRQARLEDAGEPLSVDERGTVGARIVYLNRILETRAFSWTGLLGELERALPARVRLVDIQPEPSGGRIRLSGVASGPESLAAFTRRLEGRRAFEEVFLLQQARVRQTADAGPSGIDFQVSLRYRSPR